MNPICYSLNQPLYIWHTYTHHIPVPKVPQPPDLSSFPPPETPRNTSRTPRHRATAASHPWPDWPAPLRCSARWSPSPRKPHRWRTWQRKAWQGCGLRRRCSCYRCALRSCWRSHPAPPPAGSGSVGRTPRRPFSSQSGRNAPSAHGTPRGSAQGQLGRCMACHRHRSTREEIRECEILQECEFNRWDLKQMEPYRLHLLTVHVFGSCYSSKVVGFCCRLTNRKKNQLDLILKEKGGWGNKPKNYMSQCDMILVFTQ